MLSVPSNSTLTALTVTSERTAACNVSGRDKNDGSEGRKWCRVVKLFYQKDLRNLNEIEGFTERNAEKNTKHKSLWMGTKPVAVG